MIFSGSGRMHVRYRRRVLIIHSISRLGPHPEGPLILIWDLICRELQRENIWSRIYLVPLLIAEGDRDAYRRQQAALAREQEIMKDVKGWEVSPLCLKIQQVIDTTSIRCCRWNSFPMVTAWQERI